MKIVSYVLTVVFGLIAVVLAFWFVINWTWYFGGGQDDLAKDLSAGRVCSYVRNNSDNPSCDYKTMLTIYPSAINACYEELGELEIGSTIRRNDEWVLCLIDNGVLFALLHDD